MFVEITKHARERITLYGLTESQVLDALSNPDIIIKAEHGRLIAQKRLNSHLIRVIYEEKNNSKIVVTTYKARRERYEI